MDATAEITATVTDEYQTHVCTLYTAHARAVWLGLLSVALADTLYTSISWARARDLQEG